MARKIKKLCEPFTAVPNRVFRSGLSLKAIGLLTFMVSLPEDWDFSIEGLCSVLTDGKTSIQTAVHELEEKRFLVRTQIKDEDGRYTGCEWLIDYKPIDEERLAQSPPAENQSTDTVSQLNTKEQNTNKQNTKEQNTKDISRSQNFDQFWNQYPKKVGKGQAEKAFNKACKNEVDFAAIMHGLSEQNRLKFQPMIDDGQEQYIPYPSTWLNGRRWEDKVTPYKEQKGEKSFFDLI